MKTAAALYLQIRIKVTQHSHLGMVLKYLSKHRYDQNFEVKQMMEARFLPIALDAEGNLDRRTALDCIGKLKGYIYAIEQLAGVESGAGALTKPRTTATEPDEDEDEDEDEPSQDDARKLHLADVQARIKFTEQMFGLDKP